MQQPMFGEEKKINVMVKVTGQKKVLTKSQQAFNRLTARIASLRNEIESDEARLRHLSTIFNSEITPLIKDLGREKIALAKALAAAYKTIKLTDKQKDEVESIIFDLLDDAFSVVEPDEEAEKLYNNFSQVSYKEAIKEEKEEMKEELKEQLYDMFGIDINMNDFDESPEAYARFQEKIQEKMAQQEHKQRNRKKSKTQLKKDAILQQQEEIKRRSIRSIYMSLAKLLHPDTETDERLKKEKEEIMKEVTRAYNEKDLPALLKLEMQWVATENDHLEKLTDDTLKIYIAVLKEQVKELETEKIIQINNPAFQQVTRFLSMNESAAVSAIKYEKRERAFYIEETKNHIKALEGGKLRAAIRDCIQYFYSNDKANEDEFPSFDEMMKIFMKKGQYRR
jgi:hypothetical protein